MLRNLERIIVGTALTLSASTLLPIAKSTLTPLLKMGASGVQTLTRQTKSMAQIIREEMEDIYAEAQFERMKRSMDQEITSDLAEGYELSQKGERLT